MARSVRSPVPGARRSGVAPTAPPEPDPVSTFRPDVEGLRAVAVLLVVVSHVFGVPGGGYVGVDVFFVVSGFLITGLLLREHERTGRIDLRDFYARRVRRLLPMAVLVLAVTNVAAYALFSGERAGQALRDSLWSLGFLANVRFSAIGTDYFDDTRPASPVQHYWSLAVEEQFYVVWPLLLLAALWAAQRRGAGAVLAVLSLASLVWAVQATADNATAAYFATPARAWELGVGALLALGAQAGLVQHLPLRVAVALGWLGLGGIVGSAFLLTESTPFPGTAALLPVMCTAMVLQAGEAGAADRNPVLVNPVSRYLGRVSYSLYLWHWPVLVVATAVLPGSLLVVVPLALSLALAALSHRYVEEPVRRSGWLARRPATEAAEAPQPGRRAAAAGAAAGATPPAPAPAPGPAARPWPIGPLGWAAWPAALRPQLPQLRQLRQLQQATQTARGRRAAVGLAAVTGLLGGGFLLPAVALSREATPPVAAGPVTSPQPAADPAVLTAAIAASLEPASWPELDPPLQGIRHTGAPEWLSHKCDNVNAGNLDRCRYGPADAPRTAALVGDSMAISYLPALRDVLEPQGFAIQVLTRNQCPVPAVVFYRNRPEEPYTQCADHRRWAVEQVRALDPDLVVVSNAVSLVGQQVEQPPGELRYTRWREGMTTSLTDLGAGDRDVVLIGAPPRAGNLQECVTRVSEPGDCTEPLTPVWQAVRAAEQAAARAAGATYADPEPWFCVDGRCPAVIGATPVYTDGRHLTAAYAHRLAPHLARTLPVSRRS